MYGVVKASSEALVTKAQAAQGVILKSVFIVEDAHEQANEAGGLV